MIKASEKKTQTIKLDENQSVEMAFFQLEDNGLVFALDASYVEQEVGVIVSPYEGDGAVMVDDDVECDGLSLHPDWLKSRKVDHPHYTRPQWIEAVKAGETEEGYYEWLSQKLWTDKTD